LLEAAARFRLEHRARRRDVTPPAHYALRPTIYRTREPTDPDGRGGRDRDVQAEESEARAFAERGVTVIRYEALDDRHAGLIDLLDECLALPAAPILSGFEPENVG
jgi:hypothetical protein